jgi:hypothetical protein
MDSVKLAIIFFIILYPHLMNTNEIKSLELVFRKSGECEGNKPCPDDQYCSFRESGQSKCIEKLDHDETCLTDSRCQSGHCYYFKCKAKQIMSNVKLNGYCSYNDDCGYVQYCYRGKCIDRKAAGWCVYDTHCLSNYCFLFRCVKDQDYS